MTDQLQFAGDLAGRQASATISPCGAYRYDLRRTQPGGKGVVNWIMLNPSTADAAADDPTIRRVVDFSTRWGFAGVVVTNLFAFRSTDPLQLKHTPDPVGPGNDDYLWRWAKAADLVVLAWGAKGALAGRNRKIIDMLRVAGVRPHALRCTQAGHPMHPLYIPSGVRPELYSMTEADQP